MKKCLLILCTLFLLTGCASESPESSVSESAVEKSTEAITESETEPESEIPAEEQTEASTESAEEEMPLPDNAVSLEQASELLLNKLNNYGYNTEPNQHLAYDGTRTFNYRVCYVFFSYDDFDDHRTTTGWYAVNPVTGECSDITTEKLPLFYNFEITGNGIEVYEKYADEPFQTLSIDPDFAPDPEWLYRRFQEGDNSPYSFISMNDFDFDGYDDISVLVGLGATNATVQYYRYDPENKKFESWTELNKLYFGVQAYIENETLSVHSKSSAVDAEDTVYKWAGEVLRPVSMKKRYFNGSGIFVDHIEYDDAGNEYLVKKEHLDENGELIEIVEETS